MPDICLLLICHRGGECSRWAISAVPLPCGAVFKKGSFFDSMSPQWYPRGLRARFGNAHFSFLCSVKETHHAKPMMGDCQNANGRLSQICQPLGYNTLHSHTMPVFLCSKPIDLQPPLTSLCPYCKTYTMRLSRLCSSNNIQKLTKYQISWFLDSGKISKHKMEERLPWSTG